MQDLHRVRVLPGACKLAVALIVAAVTFAVGAWAMPSCEGTYAATSLQPLPAQALVGLDVHDASPENQHLAAQFLSGVRSAGVAVGSAPNVLLHVSVSGLGGTTNRSTGPSELSYPGMSALQGGLNISPPAMPDTRLTAPRGATTRPTLIIRIDATEGQATRISWVASIQCQRTAADDTQLAYELGRVIGGSLGQRIERRVF